MNYKQLMYALGGLVTFFFISSCNFSAPPPEMSDWKQLQLKGKVKEIQETIYPNYAATQMKQPSYKVVSRFDTSGMLHDNATYLPSGQVRWIKYSYSQDSVIAEKYQELQNGKEIWQGSLIYILDERRAQKEVIDILVSRKVGHRIQITTNAAGYNIGFNYVDRMFPERVPCRVERQLNEDNQTLQESVWIYNPAEENCFEEPAVVKRANNEQGHMLAEKSFDIEGKSLFEKTYQYKYDDQGNWTERLTYTNEIAGGVSIRKIIYYDN